MRSYMKYNTVIYGFYRAKKGIDFGKSLFVLEGIKSKIYTVLKNINFCKQIRLHRKNISNIFLQLLFKRNKIVLNLLGLLLFFAFSW